MVNTQSADSNASNLLRNTASETQSRTTIQGPVDSKISKVQKKVSKQKLKETELEQQLKVARSLINNLERKLGEVQISNKILKQEINLIKSGAVERDVTQPNNVTPDVRVNQNGPLNSGQPETGEHNSYN